MAKQLARQGIEQILPPKQTRRPLPCLLIPSFFYAPVYHTNAMSIAVSKHPVIKKMQHLQLQIRNERLYYKR